MQLNGLAWIFHRLGASPSPVKSIVGREVLKEASIKNHRKKRERRERVRLPFLDQYQVRTFFLFDPALCGALLSAQCHGVLLELRPRSGSGVPGAE